MKSTMFRKLLLFLTLLVLALAVQGSEENQISGKDGFTGMGNPAALYCQELGYEFITVSDQEGERGLCVFPGGERCDAWSFLKGECGTEFSYCAQQGLETSVKHDGQNPYSTDYAVCVDSAHNVVGTVTEMMDLHEKSLGCGVSQETSRATLLDKADPDPSLTLDSSPPASFDWRALQGSNWLPPIRNQRQCGSCWAFSAVGAAEAVHNIAENDPDLDLNLSEQYLVSDCQSSGSYQNCCGGYKTSALAFIRDQGIPDEACMSYVDGSSDYDGSTCKCDYSGPTCYSSCTYRTDGSCSDKTCSDRCSDWSSRLLTVDDYGYAGTDPDGIKNALIEYGPLMASMEWEGSGNWDGDIYRCDTDDTTNHAIMIVGYDDAGGYWIVRNSWGTGWGDGGYFKLGYGECYIEEYVYYAFLPMPEIDVQGQGISITDGDNTPSTTDDTDFGGVTVESSSVIHTFTIENSGGAELDLTGTPKVEISGTHAGDFSVTAQPTSPVASGGGTTTFEVTFDPSGVGVRTAEVNIANNDVVEHPYNFTIQGEGLSSEPEIDIQGQGISIPDEDNTPSITDDTDFGAVEVTSGAIAHTFTIENSGGVELNLTGDPYVEISGAQAGDFSVSVQPTTPVTSGGGTTTFEITFDPSEEGQRTAEVSIANDDADENPYNFTVQGQGTAPEIDIQGKGLSIVDGDNTPSLDDDTDFGPIEVDSGSVTHTFTIENKGSASLDLTGTPAVEVSGSHAADFMVSAQPTTPISSGGGTTTFEITFDPSGSGVRTAEVSIANTDSDENPYNFSLQGLGAAPEIDVLGLGNLITDGDTTPSTSDGTDFGQVALTTATAVRVFTIENNGTMDLALTGNPAVEISGTNAGDFSVTDFPASPVSSGGGTTTFEITFYPAAEGLREATVSIANTDSDENPYNFAVQGTGYVKTPTFGDVPLDYWAYDYIEALYDSGITAGCSEDPLMYCPDATVTRAEMAVFLENGVHYPDDYSPPDVNPSFDDTAGHWAKDWIEALYGDGITAGCSSDPLLYCPDDSTTRAQMAVFLLKSKHGASYIPPNADATFGDTSGHWAEDWIEQLAAEGITAGCGGGNYCPESFVTRAQMAVFLVRTFNLPIP